MALSQCILQLCRWCISQCRWTCCYCHWKWSLVEKSQNNTVSQDFCEILHMCKWLKPDVLSTITSLLSMNTCTCGCCCRTTYVGVTCNCTMLDWLHAIGGIILWVCVYVGGCMCCTPTYCTDCCSLGKSRSAASALYKHLNSDVLCISSKQCFQLGHDSFIIPCLCS